jgi:hypothetical protein
LSDSLIQAVVDEAQRIREPVSCAIRALLEEAIRSRRFTGVVFREAPFGSRPCVAGTDLEIWEVVGMRAHIGPHAGAHTGGIAAMHPKSSTDRGDADR